MDTPLKITVLAFAATIALTVPASAQSALQNTNSGLQPQSTPSQNTINTQNQVGGVQTSNNGSLLNQKVDQPLGVVSNPRQSSPDAFVQPGGTQASSPQREDGPNLLVRGVVVLLITCGVVTIFYLLGRNTTEPKKVIQPVITVKPEPLPVKSKKARRKQQGIHKKKKSTRKK